MSNRSNMLQPATPALGKKMHRTNPLPLQHQLSTTVPVSQTGTRLVPSLETLETLLSVVASWGRFSFQAETSLVPPSLGLCNSSQLCPGLLWLSAFQIKASVSRPAERSRGGNPWGHGPRPLGCCSAGGFVRALCVPGCDL